MVALSSRRKGKPKPTMQLDSSQLSRTRISSKLGNPYPPYGNDEIGVVTRASSHCCSC